MGEAVKGGQNLGNDAQRDWLGIIGRRLPIDCLEHLPCSRRSLLVTDDVRDLDDGDKQRPNPLRVPGAPIEGPFKVDENQLASVGEILHEPHCPGAPGVTQGKRKGRAPIAFERRRGSGQASRVPSERFVDTKSVALHECCLVLKTEPFIYLITYQAHPVSQSDPYSSQ